MIFLVLEKIFLKISNWIEIDFTMTLAIRQSIFLRSNEGHILGYSIQLFTEKSKHRSVCVTFRSTFIRTESTIYIFVWVWILVSICIPRGYCNRSVNVLTEDKPSYNQPQSTQIFYCVCYVKNYFSISSWNTRTQKIIVAYTQIQNPHHAFLVTQYAIWI